MGGALANGLGQAISTISIIVIARGYVDFRISLSFALRVSLAALGMAATVALFVHLVPDIVGAVGGPLLGVVAYPAFLRMGRVVEEQDVERLLKAENFVPSKARPLYRRLVYMVASLPESDRPQWPRRRRPADRPSSGRQHADTVDSGLLTRVGPPATPWAAAIRRGLTARPAAASWALSRQPTGPAAAIKIGS
jgi:hypothetical protein